MEIYSYANKFTDWNDSLCMPKKERKKERKKKYYEIRTLRLNFTSLGVNVHRLPCVQYLKSLPLKLNSALQESLQKSFDFVTKECMVAIVTQQHTCAQWVAFIYGNCTTFPHSESSDNDNNDDNYNGYQTNHDCIYYFFICHLGLPGTLNPTQKS